MITRICPICKNSFTLTGVGQNSRKYCGPKCRQKADRLREKEFYAKKQHIKKVERAKKMTLDEMVREADAHGMTYGKYVAMMESD